MAPTTPEASPDPTAETPTGTSRNDTRPPVPRHEEYQYLDLVREILETGEHRPDRTGTGTYSVFGARLKFSLNRDGVPILPLLTTKRVFLRAVVAELLWFVEGNTSSTALSEKGVRIWDGNGSREFLDRVGLAHRDVGDLGPVYGFQWRHFGAEYVDARADYAGQGVDQLAGVVHKLRSAPYDRRIVMSAWNPADLDKMALPPCHILAQFYVSYPSKRRNAGRGSGGDSGGDSHRGRGRGRGRVQDEADGDARQETHNADKETGHLHCQLYQRSCDMGLGVPFNIASYALLTHMLARACDLIPGSLIHVMGDAHVYADHEDALRLQLDREPRDFPELHIRREAGCSIDGWEEGDFVVKGYNPHPTIAMNMSV